MPINNKDAVIQALANIRLESLKLSDDILELVDVALRNGEIDTTYILNLMRG